MLRLLYLLPFRSKRYAKKISIFFFLFERVTFIRFFFYLYLSENKLAFEINNLDIFKS